MQSITVILLPQLNSDSPGLCPHDAAACYFSEHYMAARTRFRERRFVLAPWAELVPRLRVDGQSVSEHLAALD